MSSILDALKKLEEERKQQLRILEKEDKEEVEDLKKTPPENIYPVRSASPELATEEREEEVSTISLEKKQKYYLPIKQVIAIISIIGVLLTLASLSLSYIIVQTQLSKVSQTIVTTTETATKKTEAHTEPEVPITNADQPLLDSSSNNKGEKIDSGNQPSETSKTNYMDNVPDKSSAQINPPPQVNPPERKNNEQTTPKVSPSEKDKVATPSKESPKTMNISQEQTIEKTGEKPQDTTVSTSSLQQSNQEVIIKPTEETIQQSNVPPSDSIPPQSIQSEKELEEKLITAKNSSQKVITPSPTPQIQTRDLPPPPTNPSQFDTTFQPKPSPSSQEPVDISKLPVLRTSDRVRLGLEDMQLNVLREPGPQNPHGLAIINLTKIYVGEMIPGTPVKLIDVRTHGIAIEVVGTGERYYVPR
ncbi:MAG: hypothetical protein N3G21_08390 [Candidatus Hydrogenedentes bacterium]|nr:hypothetical protein [Candidatus Hydrogenedentota bacterium]